MTHVVHNTKKEKTLIWYIVVVFLLFSTFVMKKSMLGCRFSIEAYAKNVREKSAKCSLKTIKVLLDAGDIYQPKFDIYQGTIAAS